MEPTKIVARRGYTLSEVLVVLALLVTVTALAQPAVRKALGDSRLRSAARQVRAELAKTRLRAMQSGVARRFRYRFGENQFEIAPANFDTEAAASGDDAYSTAAAVATVDPQHADAGLKPAAKAVVQKLPEGVSFGTPVPDAVAPIGEEGWSEPIVFFPNGRTADATIQLRGERNSVVDVSLRGLTGVARAGRPRHEKETR